MSQTHGIDVNGIGVNRTEVVIGLLRLIFEEEKVPAWVLFEGNTAVLIPDGVPDLPGYATALLTKHGPVVPGTPLGEFDVLAIGDVGWFVFASNRAIITFVTVGDARAVYGLKPEYKELDIGLLGRRLRAESAKHLEIVHVEPYMTDSPSVQD